MPRYFIIKGGYFVEVDSEGVPLESSSEDEHPGAEAFYDQAVPKLPLDLDLDL